ncbi:hypothetical protein AKO1_004880, partial [Acrasis kona]
DLLRLDKGVLLTRPGKAPINLRIRLINITCDLPAKAGVFCMKSYNEKCGCSWCLHPGKLYGKKVVFPTLTTPSGRIDPVCQDLRSVNQTNVDYENATDHSSKRETSFNGILQAPVLSRLPYWNMRTCQSIDPMHNISGVFKKLTKIWAKPTALGGLPLGSWSKFDKVLSEQKVVQIFHR